LKNEQGPRRHTQTHLLDLDNVVDGADKLGLLARERDEADLGLGEKLVAPFDDDASGRPVEFGGVS
jgi:hypothetical protein